MSGWVKEDNAKERTKRWAEKDEGTETSPKNIGSALKSIP